MPACLLAAALVSALLVRVMIRLGTLDHPVERSSHTAPTPKGGGVGIVAAAILASLLGGGMDARTGLVLDGGTLLALFSHLDDRKSRGFAAKLGVQAVAALCVLAAGWRAQSLALPGLGVMHLGAMGSVLGLGWLLFVTNAVNFIDGINGLAAGSVALACGLASLAGAPALPGLGLAAGVAGFLPFNYPRARIFMGDVGSQFCGLLAASLALREAANPAASLILPLALSPILLDAGFTLLRRWRAGERITEPHRGHLYQVASRTCLAAPWVSALYWLMAVWAGLCGWAAAAWGSAAQARGLGMALLPACLALAWLPVVRWGLWVARGARRAGLTRW